jgi:phage terminase large subunit
MINTNRIANGRPTINFEPFRGSGAVVDPTADPFKASNETKDGLRGRTNEDLFANAKAQAWWSLRRRFQLTYRAVVEGLPYDKDDIISIASSVNDIRSLIIELSQPTYSQNAVGKIVVDKMPDGTRSPNKADAVMIAFAPIKRKPAGFFT